MIPFFTCGWNVWKPQKAHITDCRIIFHLVFRFCRRFSSESSCAKIYSRCFSKQIFPELNQHFHLSLMRAWLNFQAKLDRDSRKFNYEKLQIDDMNCWWLCWMPVSKNFSDSLLTATNFELSRNLSQHGERFGNF